MTFCGLTFSHRPHQVLAQYPGSQYPPSKRADATWWAFSHVLGDTLMSCAARRTARWLLAPRGIVRVSSGATLSSSKDASSYLVKARGRRAADKVSVYLYLFAHKLRLTGTAELAMRKPLGE